MTLGLKTFYTGILASSEIFLSTFSWKSTRSFVAVLVSELGLFLALAAGLPGLNDEELMLPLDEMEGFNYY